MVCGEPVALSVTLAVAVLVPPSVGENRIPTTQFWLGVSTPPEQPSATMEKSPTFVPLSPTPVTVRFWLPVLVTLKFSVPLVVPTFCLANVSGEGGARATAGPATTAVPVSVMVRGLPVSESLKVTLAVSVPVAVDVGLNTMDSEQTARAPRERWDSCSSTGSRPDSCRQGSRRDS